MVLRATQALVGGAYTYIRNKPTLWLNKKAPFYIQSKRQDIYHSLIVILVSGNTGDLALCGNDL